MLIYLVQDTKLMWLIHIIIIVDYQITKIKSQSLDIINSLINKRLSVFN